MNIHVPTDYECYLQSEDFDKIRQAVFERDGHKCVVCGSQERIVPHHLTYRNIYNEPVRDLITLCTRCHSIYHSIARRAEAVDKYYSANDAYKTRQKIEEDMQKREKERTHDEAVRDKVIQSIKDEFLEKDYCKNGDLDMCDWNVLNAAIRQKMDEFGMKSEYMINKSKLQKWFLYRRCELFKRCLDKGLPLKAMQEKTKFDPGYLYKWYRRPRVEAKLNEETQLLNN